MSHLLQPEDLLLIFPEMLEKPVELFQHEFCRFLLSLSIHDQIKLVEFFQNINMLVVLCYLPVRMDSMSQSFFNFRSHIYESILHMNSCSSDTKTILLLVSHNRIFCAWSSRSIEEELEESRTEVEPELKFSYSFLAFQSPAVVPIETFCTHEISQERNFLDSSQEFVSLNSFCSALKEQFLLISSKERLYIFSCYVYSIEH